MSLNSDQIRPAFSSLSRLHRDQPLIYLDGPGGTQVPDAVIAAMNHYYANSNTNTHGQFITSMETDDMITTVRRRAADLLGAEGPDNISFGQNMTTLNYALARGIGRTLQPGDEVLITQLDHEGNRGPWLALREIGVVVREVRMLQSGSLDYDDLEEKLNDRTRLVAVGYASNALGTVNDIQKIRSLTYQFNTELLIDAVHFAPHFAIDVGSLGCDYLLCSAYKFYGPHVGILYSKTGHLDRLPTDRLITTDQMAPYSIETGTLNHASLAGVAAAIDFIAGLGSGTSPKTTLNSAYEKIGAHEGALARKLYDGLSNLEGVAVVGNSFDVPLRAPTISFAIDGLPAAEVCRQLAESNICAWDGHFYAQRAIEVLGLMETGGVTRMGFSIYNTMEEVDHTLEAVSGITNRGKA